MINLYRLFFYFITTVSFQACVKSLEVSRCLKSSVWKNHCVKRKLSGDLKVAMKSTNWLNKLPGNLKIPAIFATGVIAGACIGPLAFDSIKVYDTAGQIPSALIKSKKSLNGIVASVTDGDTIRLRHKKLLSDGKFKGNLSDKTIVVRIAAVDAPETAKFGKEGQPFGEDAKQWVKKEVLGKKVKVQLLSRDQYQRVVGMVTYGQWPFKKNLSEELLKRGLAVIYRQGGAEYGDNLEEFEKIEKVAKTQRMGLWSSTFETPSEYKARTKVQNGLAQ